MSLLNTADKVYFASSAVDKIYLGNNIIWTAVVGEPVDPAYGTGVYGPPLTITTTNGDGLNTFSSRKRISVALAELETNYLNVGEPYRIDFDIVEAPANTLVRVDWCDVAPGGELTVVSGMHTGYESQGRYGGYSSTYRFTDIEPLNGVSITINNLTVRRIYEFSS